MTIPTPDEICDFLHELDGWERAYPLSAFPEPDMRKAAELLKAGGMTLDAISASNMRHVVSQIAPKAADLIQQQQATIERLSAEKVELREALLQAAVPLEGLLAARQWVELSPESWSEIKNGVAHIRTALGGDHG